jgi:hypothetical protein
MRITNNKLLMHHNVDLCESSAYQEQQGQHSISVLSYRELIQLGAKINAQNSSGETGESL